MAMAAPVRRLLKPALFICDIQEKFRPAIHEYPRVIATAQKMIKASQLLSIPIYATTQNRSRLGDLCTELHLSTPSSTTSSSPTTPPSNPPLHPIHAFADKTAFSMYIPPLTTSLAPGSQVAIVGIETHICVTQTTLDLLAAGHKVYVLADGVSSCNEEERKVALERVAREGAVVTTSEGFLYECMGDAGLKEFKGIAGLVKETKDSTRDSLKALCSKI